MNIIYILFIIYYALGLLNYIKIILTNKKKIGRDNVSLLHDVSGFFDQSNIYNTNV